MKTKLKTLSEYVKSLMPLDIAYFGIGCTIYK